MKIYTSLFQAFGHLVSQPASQSKSVSQSVNHSGSKSGGLSQSVSPSQLVSQSKSVSWLASLWSVGRSVGRSVSQSVQVSQSVSQLVTYSIFKQHILFTLGLILNAVHPFTSIDYTSYRSAGFRGHLDKGFHTVNGLTHVFVHGVPLEAVPDLE